MAIAAASADGKVVFGKNGLFDELKKALAERMRMAPRLMSSPGIGHLSKNDFMLSRSTASVWPDEAGGCHDRDRLPRCDLVWHSGRKGNGDGKAVCPLWVVGQSEI
jgi:hypothetical protein